MLITGTQQGGREKCGKDDTGATAWAFTIYEIKKNSGSWKKKKERGGRGSEREREEQRALIDFR